MSQHFNGLTPAEAERLALLAEECAECIHAVAKILRHGYESTNPDVNRSGTNRNSLVKEMGDVHAAMTLLWDAGDTSREEVHACADDKLTRVQQYLHHQDSK